MRNRDDQWTWLLVADHPGPRVRLGEYLAHVESTLADMQQRQLVARIWRKDPTVWLEDPSQQEGLVDRLGWLFVTNAMDQQLEVIQGFAQEVQQAGFRHVVLLGMGGSSLCGEVFRQSLGSSAGYPGLLVLDSTVPAAVESIAAAIDPEATLFLVSSKSGTTTETVCLYRHFRELVEGTMARRSGEHFVAITDPGTPLQALAAREGFRRIFLNPPDLGGRYSVLSYSGLVPASLTGIDLQLLLRRADVMRERCASWVPTQDNPGAWLGATMATLARQGHDKLTLLLSPTIAALGLWVEQLIAESTGKEGKGILPVVGEPLTPLPSPTGKGGPGVGQYGTDRQFVFLRLEEDDNTSLDAAAQGLQQAGHPLVCLTLRDRYDLGAEFFRWEFATAVAGALLGIHPFDEPDVQRSKDNTTRLLEAYQGEGHLPPIAGEDTLDPPSSTERVGGGVRHLLSQAQPGDYLSVMAYIQQTPEIDALLHELRRWVLLRHPIATTVGYGPRFLHSTGQFHKGGPPAGLYLQLTADQPTSRPIAGQGYSFAALVAAQAMGDLTTLQSLGRRVVRVHLGTDPVAGLRRLLDQLQ